MQTFNQVMETMPEKIQRKMNFLNINNAKKVQLFVDSVRAGEPQRLLCRSEQQLVGQYFLHLIDQDD